MRAEFFGEEASVQWNIDRLMAERASAYTHARLDIRDAGKIDELFRQRRPDAIIHAAAQPSHDWAASDPQTDASVNFTGTLNLLEATRTHCAESPFIFLSTNKVYGDGPNHLPFVREESRFELPREHELFGGIPESFS